MPKPLRIRYSRIARTVEELLDRYGVDTAPIDIARIAEGEGFSIEHDWLEDELSGFLLKTNSGFVIGVNSRHARTRQRFTIAHECGHALLHGDGLDELHVDRAFKLRSPLSSQAVDIEEIEANAFAASILMPERILRPMLVSNGIFDAEDERQIESLARLFEVSPLSMSWRVQNLLSRSR